jgi:hypothetical protein
MGTNVQFFVCDQNGNAIQGAKVEAHSHCAGIFGGGMNFGGSTNGSGYTNYLDSGCNLGGQATATASAEGYQSNTITFSLPECSLGSLCGTIHQTISLNQLSTVQPVGTTCPNGYTYSLVSDSCVKNSGTTSYSIDNFFATIKKNWLLIAVFIFIIVLAYIMVKRPDIIKKTTSSISKGINKVIPK